MNSINNFLNYLSDNWIMLLLALCIGFTLGKEITSFIKLDKETKINVAKRQIEETMLKLVTEAEIDFEAWNKSGSIKRAQVIAKIYEKYPILSKAVSQDSVIEWIDKAIDNSLKTLREILKDNRTEIKEE